MKLTRKNSPEAFTLIELLVAISTTILLAAILLPESRRRDRCMEVNCVNNLKQIGMSFLTWSLDNQGKYPMQVAVTNGGSMELVSSGLVFPHFLVMSNELSTPRLLICPEDFRPAIRSATSFSGAIAPSSGQIPFTNDNQVSYFVGVDAEATQSSAILCGDQNLVIGGMALKHGLHSVWTNSAVSWIKPRHGSGGNIGLADGRVQRVDTPGLRQLLVETDAATNRLAIP